MRDQINAWHNDIGFIQKSDLVCTPQKHVVLPEYPSFQKTKICVQTVLACDPAKLQRTGPKMRG